MKPLWFLLAATPAAAVPAARTVDAGSARVIEADHACAGGALRRYTSAFWSGTTVRSTIDRLFASRANVPASGKSRCRFGAGHDALQCEASHGATPAGYPNSHANANVQSPALQRRTGTLSECATGRATASCNGVHGGSHGMHGVSQALGERAPGFAQCSRSRPGTSLIAPRSGASTDALQTGRTPVPRSWQRWNGHRPFFHAGLGQFPRISSRGPRAGGDRQMVT